MMSKDGEDQERIQWGRMWLAMWGARNTPPAHRIAFDPSTEDGISPEDLQRLRLLLPDLSDELIRRLVNGGVDEAELSSPTGIPSTKDRDEEWLCRLIPRSRACSDVWGHASPPWVRGADGGTPWWAGGVEVGPPWAGGPSLIRWSEC